MTGPNPGSAEQPAGFTAHFSECQIRITRPRNRHWARVLQAEKKKLITPQLHIDYWLFSQVQRSPFVWAKSYSDNTAVEEVGCKEVSITNRVRWQSLKAKTVGLFYIYSLNVACWLDSTFRIIDLRRDQLMRSGIVACNIIRCTARTNYVHWRHVLILYFAGSTNIVFRISWQYL